MIRKFSGAGTQLAKDLPSVHEDLVSFPAWDEADVLALACYHSTWVGRQEDQDSNITLSLGLALAP